MISPLEVVRRGMDRASELNPDYLVTAATALGALGVGAILTGKPLAAIGFGSAEFLTAQAARRSDRREQLAHEVGQHLIESTPGLE